MTQDLSATPTLADLDEARRIGAVGAYNVSPTYSVDDGVLVSAVAVEDEVARTYIPLVSKSIVGEFVHLEVGDERGLVAFARRWGLLGYDNLHVALIGHAWAPVGGDPVAWVWAHLAGIKTVMSLFRVSRKDGPDALLRELQRLQLSRLDAALVGQTNVLLADRRFHEADELLKGPLSPKATNPVGRVWPRIVYGNRWGVTQRTWSHATANPTWATQRLMSDVINVNAHGVHADINRWFGTSPDEPVVVTTFDCLLSVIYWHVREILLGGNKVAECLECRSLFVQTDGRQRFCPPPSWSKRASQCAMRSRKRAQRKRAGTRGGD